MRKTQSNSATLNCGALERIGTACARDVAQGRSACRRTTPYMHAEASPRPMDHASRSLMLVHDVGGPEPGHAALPHRPDGGNRLAPLVDGRRTSPPPSAILRPCCGPHRSLVALARKEAPPPPCARLQKPHAPSSREFPSRRRHHWCSVDELQCPLVTLATCVPEPFSTRQ
jgi:hypothetical protein